jgi:RimJ/RimL family protein N-acetyltransferase
MELANLTNSELMHNSVTNIEAVVMHQTSETAPRVITANDFYLCSPNSSDVETLAEFAKIKTFFFAPFNNAIKEQKVSPFAAAGTMLYGRQGDIILSVRLKDSDRFVGCIRFTEISRSRRAELSYFFTPYEQRKGLGKQAVLRAVDWAVRTKDVKAIWATVDPDNTASYKILRRAGLKVSEDGFRLPDETKYFDHKRQKRPRLVMEGTVKKDICPALTSANSQGHYHLTTPVLGN